MKAFARDTLRSLPGYPLMGGLRLADAAGWLAAALALVALGGLGVVWFAAALWRALPW